MQDYSSERIHFELKEARAVLTEWFIYAAAVLTARKLLIFSWLTRTGQPAHSRLRGGTDAYAPSGNYQCDAAMAAELERSKL